MSGKQLSGEQVAVSHRKMHPVLQSPKLSAKQRDGNGTAPSNKKSRFFFCNSRKPFGCSHIFIQKQHVHLFGRILHTLDHLGQHKFWIHTFSGGSTRIPCKMKSWHPSCDCKQRSRDHKTRGPGHSRPLHVTRGVSCNFRCVTSQTLSESNLFYHPHAFIFAFMDCIFCHIHSKSKTTSTDVLAWTTHLGDDSGSHRNICRHRLADGFEPTVSISHFRFVRFGEFVPCCFMFQHSGFGTPWNKNTTTRMEDICVFKPW